MDEEKIYDEMERASELDFDSDACIAEFESYSKTSCTGSTEVVTDHHIDNEALVDSNDNTLSTSKNENKRSVRLPDSQSFI